jgi:AcrR family transcriptional regulator
MIEGVNGNEAWPRRRARASATRAKILHAASELFLREGYVAATMPAIADAAGVSRATVFNSVGGKADVLKGCYDIAVVGDDIALPIYARPEMKAMFAEPDPRAMITRYAAIIASIGARVSPIYEVFRAAAGADPQVRAMWTQIQDERHLGATRFAEMFSAKSALPNGLSLSEAADIIWVLIDNSLYHRLVIERSWAADRFERWFATTLCAHMLDDQHD